MRLYFVNVKWYGNGMVISLLAFFVKNLQIDGFEFRVKELVKPAYVHTAAADG